jgi:hypothetical protein
VVVTYTISCVVGEKAVYLRDDVLQVGDIVGDGAAAHIRVLDVEQDADRQRRLQERESNLIETAAPFSEEKVKKEF